MDIWRSKELTTILPPFDHGKIKIKAMLSRMPGGPNVLEMG